MNVLDLFSGIGGFSLGLERAGMKTVAFCETDPFCQKVLKKHWPDVPIFNDIKELHAESISETVNVVAGGFPCQPFSVAGEQCGKEDDRYLWPEMRRIIAETRPSWVIGENVTGIINMELDNVLADLENEKYTCWTTIIPACAIGSNHRRDRIWIIANASSGRCKRDLLKVSTQEQDNRTLETLGSQHWCGGPFRNWQKLMGEPEFCRVDDGVSSTVDIRPRLHAYGNAVVPQIPEIIGRAIMEIESKG